MTTPILLQKLARRVMAKARATRRKDVLGSMLATMKTEESIWGGTPIYEHLVNRGDYYGKGPFGSGPVDLPQTPAKG